MAAAQMRATDLALTAVVFQPLKELFSALAAPTPLLHILENSTNPEISNRLGQML
jgi:hypothetical protein